MRLALIATPALLHDLRPAPGALDGDLLRVRLPRDDAAFRVVDIDPAVDVAEQLDRIFDATPAGEDDPVLLYVSCAVVVSREGELFLCLDPADPDTGAALEEVTAVVRDRAPGPVLFVLECRHPPDPDDPFRSAAIVAAARAAVASASTGVELLVAARPQSDDEVDRASPFTRAVVSALDELAGSEEITAERLYEHLLDGETLLGVVPCFAHTRGRVGFPLVPEDAPHSDATPWPEEVPVSEDVPVSGGGEEDDVPVDLDDIAAGASAPDEVAADADALPGDRSAPADEGIAADAGAGLEGGDALGASEAISSAVDNRPTPVQEPPRHDDDDSADSRRTRVTPVSSIPTTGQRDPDTERDAEAAVASTERSPTGGPASRRSSLPPTAMPSARSFLRSHQELARVIVSERPPPPPDNDEDEDDIQADTGRQTPPDTPSARARSASHALASTTTPEAAPPSSAPPASVRAPVSARAPASGPMSGPPARPDTGGTLAEHLAASEVTEDPEAALRELKSALAQLGSSATVERAGVYVRIAAIKRRQDKPREAISNLEKALTLAPGHRGALEELLELDVAARDWRAVANAEEQLLTTVTDDGERFQRLLQFAERWEVVAGDRERACKALERARELRGGDPGLLASLRRIYEAVGDVEAAIAVRRRLAEVAQVPREQARGYYELGQYLAFELHREDAALELFDRALETDPSMLEPLEVVATLLGERMDYGELERAYRRMLERIQRVPRGSVRSEVTWELCRRLGLLFRDHLENAELALDAFEDATGEKPDDIGSHLIAADLAKRVGRFDRAALHLQAAVAIDPGRVDLFHDLFDTFQKARSPDQAYAAACVTMFLRASEARERFVFEEHKPEGVPRMTRPLPEGGWDLLRAEDRHRDVEAILAAIAPAAIAMRLAQLQKEKKLPALDPAARQDPETSTASIVRSFKWASHFLGVGAPAIYVHDDAAVNLAAVPAEEPSVFAGGGVLRGKTEPELAFLVGRHLAYYLPPHRLLLFYSSIEDLSALFVAAVTLVLPGVPVPRPLAEATHALRRDLGVRLGAEAKAELARAVEAFEAGGTRADLARWVGAVERCATRAGLLLSGDLEVAAAVVRSDGRGVIGAEAKIGDMTAFLVSDAYHTLRRLLGVAVEP
ncbi:MAG: hypothetical protein WKG00_06880 [Polyangiaceae bacterium]